VYSDRTRGELQVAKNNFFCSGWMEQRQITEGIKRNIISFISLSSHQRKCGKIASSFYSTPATITLTHLNFINIYSCEINILNHQLFQPLKLLVIKIKNNNKQNLIIC
jgi:hypothetical protein